MRRGQVKVPLLLREKIATKGSVAVNGYNLNKLKRKNIPQFRRSIGFVFQDFRLIPTMNVYDNVAFALRVTGDSMTEAGILDGDIIVVKKDSCAENGDIVVALVEDSATVKTFYRENGHFRLQPENRTMKPIIVDEVYILGKVVADLRFY